MTRQLRQRGSIAGRGQAGISLVELLVAMSILSIVTTMILVSWFALQDSYSMTVRSDNAQTDARFAMSRMVRELRDAQALPGASVIEAVVRDVPGKVEYVQFWTKFNHPNRLLLTRFEFSWTTNAVTGLNEGAIYRILDSDGNGIDNVDRQDAMLILAHVVNRDATSVFAYTTMTAYGDPLISPPSPLPSSSAQLATIAAVQIRLMVDLNPGKSPTYMDLRSTAQLRNTRQF